MQSVVGTSMRTWRVPVLRQAQLPESPVYFSSGAGHQHLDVYTVVYAGTQLWIDSKRVGSPHLPGAGW